MRLTARVERLERELETAERLLLEVQNAWFFRLLHWPGRFGSMLRRRLGQTLLHSRLHPLYLKIAPRRAPQEIPALPETEPAPPASRPVISVLLPVHNPTREWLRAAVESVERQSYPEWELCVCDDASAAPWVREYLEGKARGDPRIRVIRSDANVGIAGATNLAGSLAGGEYAGFLDQDDLLAPGALLHVARAVEDGAPDLVYSDEDRLDESGRHVEPIFRPAWSPDLLLSCMYMGHFLVVRRAALERAGGLRSACDGAQDYDLALRSTEGAAVVRHIPRILYHWRKHAGSSASHAGAKPYTQAAGARALSDALARRSVQAEAAAGPFPNAYRIRRPAGSARASIVICTRSAPLMRRCLRELHRRTAYANREVVAVQHLTGADRKLGGVLARAGCVSVPYTGPFDFAAMCNLGANHAAGEVLVFLNDDVTPLSPEWLEALVAQAVRPEVGAVGARLLYPYGGIQHAGLAIGIMHGVGHPQRHTFDSGYWNWSRVTRNVSAVTGACMAIRKSVFQELGGFDSSFPVNYNDADLCLRAREAGYEVIYEPAALLRHAEACTRRPEIRFAERALWDSRWGRWREAFYSPSLAADREDAGLSSDPRYPDWR
jgi:O-antigen biosynthesis protein